MEDQPQTPTNAVETSAKRRRVKKDTYAQPTTTTTALATTAPTSTEEITLAPAIVSEQPSQEGVAIQGEAQSSEPQLLFVDPAHVPPGLDRSQLPLYYLVRTPGADGLRAQGCMHCTK